MLMATIGRTRLPAGDSALSPAEMNGTQTTRPGWLRPLPAKTIMAACNEDMARPVKGIFAACSAAPTVTSTPPAAPP